MNAARTITYKGYVYAQPSNDWEKGNTNAINGLTYFVHGVSSDKSIAEIDVTFQLPEGFDPVSQAVKDLEKKRETLRAEFQMALNEVNDRIGKLQAITCEVPA